MYGILRNIGPIRRQFIKDVEFLLYEVNDDKKISNMAMEMLSRCKALRTLTVQIIHRSANLSSPFPTQVFPLRANPNILRAAGIKKLREIRGCTEVNVAEVDPVNEKERQSGYTSEQVKELESVLKEELCRKQGTERLAGMDEKWKECLRPRVPRN